MKVLCGFSGFADVLYAAIAEKDIIQTYKTYAETVW